ELNTTQSAEPDAPASHRHCTFGDTPCRANVNMIGGPVPLHDSVGECKPDIPVRVGCHGANDARPLAKLLVLVAPCPIGKSKNFARSGRNPRVVMVIDGERDYRVHLFIRVVHWNESSRGGPPEMEIANAGRPDRSIAVAANANRLAGCGKTGDRAIG